jgi:hypothetical protein
MDESWRHEVYTNRKFLQNGGEVTDETLWKERNYVAIRQPTMPVIASSLKSQAKHLTET